MRRHRTNNAYNGLVTPRVSNHSGGYRDPESISSQHSKQRDDPTKMQHYQYQEDRNQHQQFESKQKRPQRHNRNYSEERQTTSECSRASSSTPQRDDNIAHWCTPPRSNVPLHGANDHLYHCPRGVQIQNPDHFNSSQYKTSDNNMLNGASQSRKKRSQSTGVVDMTRAGFYSNSNNSLDGYSKDDQDSKKSKSNKSLISRASHKIKKRFVGSSSSGSQGKEKNDDRRKQYYDPGQDISLTSRLTNNISTMHHNCREGRDPSPSGGSVGRRQRLRSVSGENSWSHSLSNQMYDDMDNIAQDYQSVDHSDMSTLESNFTYPIGDVLVGSAWTKERQLSNDVVLGTPPRVPRETRPEPSSSGRFRDSRLSNESNLHQSCPEVERKSMESQTVLKSSAMERKIDEITNDIEFQQVASDTNSSSAGPSHSHLEEKISSLESELRKKSEELAKSNETMLQLASDLDSYKQECVSHRERVLQSERENVKMEQLVYNERKKVLSLEAENQMLLNVADERLGTVANDATTKESEMSAFKEQCKKYRDRVIKLEQQLITSESALEATAKMGAILEDEKKAISAALDQRIISTNSLMAELDEKENKLRSTLVELSTLQSKLLNLNNSNRNYDDSKRTISVLESENYSLLRKIEAQSLKSERVQKDMMQYAQLESEHKELKKRNDELQMNDATLRKQLLDAQDAVSNSERLKKNIADSESFIQSLQNDLAETRSVQHQQLIDLKNTHIVEMDTLSHELLEEKKSKRQAEKHNHELEEKITRIETANDQLNQQLNNQSKAHSEHIAALRQQLDEVRNELTASREDTNKFKQECDDKSQSHEKLVASLRGAMDESSRAISTLKEDLEVKTKEVKGLQLDVEEKDRTVNNLKSDLSLHEYQRNEIINRLEHDIEVSLSEKEALKCSNEAMQSQIQAIKVNSLQSIELLRKEKASLASDVQTYLIDAKTDMIKHVNVQLRSLENHNLNQLMNHQVAIASARAEHNKLDLLFQVERNKVHNLEKSLNSLHDKEVGISKTMKVLCAKLGVQEKDIVDKVEDLQMELSESRSEIATSKIDLTTIRSELAKIEHENNQFSLDNDHFKNVLEMERSQLNTRNEKIHELEQTLARAHNEIASHENVLNGVRRENESLSSQLEVKRNELVTLSDDVRLLNEQLLEKTEIIHGLNESLSQASQKAADDLANHYMKIEDNLRAQLREKEVIENKIKAQNEESQRVIEELRTAKDELSTCVDRLSEDLSSAETEIQHLRDENGKLFEERNEIIKEMNITAVKDSSTSNQIMSLTSTIDKLNDVYASTEREHTAEFTRVTGELIQSHSHEIDELHNKLLDATSLISELKAALEESNVENSCDHEFYKTELANQEATHAKAVKDKDAHIESLKDQIKQLTATNFMLEESIRSVEQVSLEREDLIKELKLSLRDSLQNALQSDASKRETDEKIAEITDTLSNFDQVDECNSSLTGSLSGTLHIKSTVERLISDNKDLELKLALAEKQMTERRAVETHLESKLSSVIQVNEKLQEEYAEQQSKFRQLNDETKERSADQEWMASQLMALQNDRQKEADTCRDLVARLQKELKSAKQKEDELTRQVMVLQQDCDVEHLYKELVDKMKEREMHYECEIQKMIIEHSTLKDSVTSLSEEKQSLVHAYDEAKSNNSMLSEKLSSVEDELRALRSIALQKDCHNDEASTASSMASHMLKQTASDLDSTMKAIKKHHSSKVRKLQSDLDEVRTLWKKSEDRVQELTKLLQDNSLLVEALHKKLATKKRQQKRNKTQASSTFTE